MTTASARSPKRPIDRTEAFRMLRSAGGRLTAAKREIVEVFFGASDGLTAEEVGERLPHVDQATIYRSLQQFEHAGIVEHVHLGHGAATYRLAGAGSVPVVCEVCGRVVDVPARELDDLARMLRRTYGMTLEIGHFALTGRCTTCQPR
jgi:Fur family transcriptional regulator, ferric uptake regulator